MPIYEYECHHCRGQFDVLVRGQERPTCPQCGGQQLEKLLSVPAAHVLHKSAAPVCDPTPSGCGRCGRQA